MSNVSAIEQRARALDEARNVRDGQHRGDDRLRLVHRDEVVEPNLVWKDTVLVRTGETVDILLDVTNPGRWMAHCHIAEHHVGTLGRKAPCQPSADPAATGAHSRRNRSTAKSRVAGIARS